MAPTGTALDVILDNDVRVKNVGQSIHARTIEPVYVFDKLMVPVGAEVTGTITRLESVSNGERALEALNADFTPPRKVTVEFNELKLPNGRSLALQTDVTAGSAQVINFVAAQDDSKGNSAKQQASEKAREAKEQAKRDWDNAVAQVQQPGKFHRLERYAMAQIPFHPQYIDAGTVYYAELRAPLDFGSEVVTQDVLESIGTTPPDGTSVRARLTATVSSSTARRGDAVTAVLSQPLFADTRLVFPEGSRLTGSVVQARPARFMSRNGQLRIVFHEIVPPDGIERAIQSTVEGAQSGKDQNVKIDSEGGAEAQTPKTRYLQTAVALGLAAASSGDDLVNGAAGGAGGFRLVGIALGMGVRSQPFSMAMGAFGASRSIYVHFIARGRDVVFPKNTTMQIGIGPRPAPDGMK